MLDGALKAAGVELVPGRAGVWLDQPTMKQRLIEALEASGLFAARERRPEAPRSRGVRLITLDDE
jgi:hypothetical protein